MTRAALVAAVLAVAVPAWGKTIITDYTYNPDGALTAIATSVDGGDPTTKYLTWDDFVPDENDPATGTVSIGNGRLVGWGPKPGTANLTERFSFDRRDRLTAYEGPAGGESYDYHADGTMASSTTGTDSLRFYFDRSADPQMTNIFQQGPDRWSAYLGGVQYLSDGSEQARLKPRKDTAGTYEPQTGVLQSYVYDAYGAQPDASTQSDYDLHRNPFQYAGEYRDPVWGGYYLRARWYDPDLPSFLSRDPESNLSRYGYAGGNPVMNVDPSGRSFKSFAGGVEHALQSLDQKLNTGVGGHFARLFLAPLVGPLQILAYPKQFWDEVRTNRGGIDVLLAVGVASEIGGGLLDAAYAGEVAIATRFARRATSDVVIGGASSVGAGASRGFNHFNWNNFAQGLEYTAGGLGERFFNGPNVRSPFQLSTGDVGKLVEDLKNAPANTTLVFRQRTELPQTFGGLEAPLKVDSPFLQSTRLGFYHERLVALTKNQLFMNDAVSAGVRVSEEAFEQVGALKGRIAALGGKFELVAKVTDFDPDKFLINPRGFRVNQVSGDLLKSPKNPQVLGVVTNNCHDHAYSVLRQMRLRR